MADLTAFAPAKINLSLAISGRRDDGYHLMDSLVIFADLSDQITSNFANEDTLSVSGPFAEKLKNSSADENIIMQAVHAYRLETGWKQPFAISLIKNIPVAAGIGGGSSNAAATLRALNTACPTPLSEEKLHELGLGLGADVPVCLKSYDHHLWRMRGIGEKLDHLDYPASSSLGLILLNPGVSVPTGAIFQSLRTSITLDGFQKENPHPHKLDDDTFRVWLDDGNSLTAPALSLHQKIEEALRLLSALSDRRGFITSGMSGSGATVFALFRSKALAMEAAQSLKTSFWFWAGGIFNAE